MKRSDIAAFFDLGDYIIIYKGTAEKLFSSVNHPVTHSLNILQSGKHSMFLVQKRIKDSLDTYSVVSDRHLCDEFLLSGGLMLDATCFHSNPLDKALGKKIINFITLHIQKLVLE